MASFSNDFIDKEHGSSVPAFAKAVQISDLEKLRIKASALRDATDRTNCLLRLDYAEESYRAMQGYFEMRRKQYVDNNLKLDLQLQPGLWEDTRSYDQRVRELRYQYTQTQQAMVLRADIEARDAQLHQNVRDRLAKALWQDRAVRQGQNAPRDAGPARGLTPSFHRARDR